MFSKSLLASLLAIPFVAQTVLATPHVTGGPSPTPSPTCTRTYTVKDCDTCDSISADQHVSTFQLAMVNYGIIDQDCSNLEPGEVICLGHPSEDCTDTYVVESCDTCEDISAAKGVPLDMLYLNNPQIDDDCSNIYVGEVLCVAKTPTVPTVPDGCQIDHDIPYDAVFANPDDDDDDDDDSDDVTDDAIAPADSPDDLPTVTIPAANTPTPK